MRYLRFRAWLDSVATDIAQPAAIYFEEVRGHAVRTQNLYGGFLASAAWERRACLHHWRGDRPRCRCGRLRSGDGGGPHMTGEEKRHSAARLVADRRESYGDPAVLMAAIATRWSITLGQPVTAGQVLLCLIDLKLARLAHEDGGSARLVALARTERRQARLGTIGTHALESNLLPVWDQPCDS